MDEREVVQLFAQDVPETPEAIGIGSSRVLQFNRENTGIESFFTWASPARTCATT